MSETLELEAKLKDYITGNMPTIIGAMDNYEKKIGQVNVEYQRMFKTSTEASRGTINDTRQLIASTDQAKSAFRAFADSKIVDYTREEGTRIGAIRRIATEWNAARTKESTGHQESVRESQSLTQSWNTAKIAMSGLVTAIGGMYILNRVVGFMKEARTEYQTHVQQQLLLKNAIGFTSFALNEQAKALSKKLVIDDDDITKVQVKLANYVKNEDAVKRLTPAVLNLAAATGTDLNFAAQMVARSVSSSTGELARFKIKVDGASDSGQRIDSIIKGINEKMGDAAVASAQARDGFDKMGVTWKDFEKSVGKSKVMALWSAGTAELLDKWVKGMDQLMGVNDEEAKQAAVKTAAIEKEKLEWRGLIKEQEDELSWLSKQNNPTASMINRVNDLSTSIKIAKGEIQKLNEQQNPKMPPRKKTDEEIEKQLSLEIEYYKLASSDTIAILEKEYQLKIRIAHRTGEDTYYITKMYEERKKQAIQEINSVDQAAIQSSPELKIREQENLKVENAEREHNKAMLTIDDYYAQQNREMQDKLRRDKVDETLETIEWAKQAGSELANAITNTDASKKRIKELKDQQAEELKAEKLTQEQKLKINQKYSKLINEEKGNTSYLKNALKGFMKVEMDFLEKWVIAKITQNALNNIGTLGIMGLAKSAIEAGVIMGIFETAKAKMAGFSEGGIVGGGRSSQGDIIPAMLTPKEMVLNDQQQANLFSQLQRPNVSNNSAINLHINVGSGGNYDMNAARHTVDALVPVIGEALVRAKNEGRLRNYEAAR